MDLSSAVHTPEEPTPLPIQSKPFLAKLREILAKESEPHNGRHLCWTSNGKGFYFNRLHLETYLGTETCELDTPSVELFIGQLKAHGFHAIDAELNDNENDDFLAFSNSQFTRDDSAAQEPLPVVTVKPLKPIYCTSEKNYLRYKRAHDPCYKLIQQRSKYSYDVAKERFRAVIAQEKLKKTINSRLNSQSVTGADVFRDLLPNETNIAIQMGAIAGYYGETVVEEDLIRFFGKFLPMYKPISDVVDSITPSISNKIQSSNFMWRNQSTAAVYDQGGTAIVTSNSTKRTGMVKQGTTTCDANFPSSAAGTAAHDPCNDITFEYVSFKDQQIALPSPLPPVATLLKNKSSSHQLNDSSAASSAIGLVSVVGQGVNSSSQGGDAVLIGHQQRDDFMPLSGDCDDGEQMHSVAYGNMQQFTTNLLDSNYYDTSSHDFGMELKNAIDLIMN